MEREGGLECDGVIFSVFQLKSIKTKRFLLSGWFLKGGFCLFFDWWRMTSSTSQAVRQILGGGFP